MCVWLCNDFVVLVNVWVLREYSVDNSSIKWLIVCFCFVYLFESRSLCIVWILFLIVLIGFVLMIVGDVMWIFFVIGVVGCDVVENFNICCKMLDVFLLICLVWLVI